MFIYDTKLPFEVRITRPDMKYYLLLDRQLKGCSSGLKQAAVYIRQSFMINNPTFHDKMCIRDRYFNCISFCLKIVYHKAW